MGSAPPAQPQLRSRAHTEQLHYLYQSNKFISMKKSPSRLKVELQAIRRKVSYLPYDWARTLETHLRDTPEDDLYNDYQAVLKENCRREGRREKIFSSSKMRKKFSEDFMGRYLVSSEKLTAAQLGAAFEECKCYLMVLGWLHNLATLQSCENEPQDVGELSRQAIENSRLAEEAIIYEMLVKLSMQHFAENLQLGENSADEDGVYSEKLAHFKQDVAKIVRKLNKRCHFFERERLIGELQDLLMKDRDDLEENVRLVMEYLGRENIMAHLHTIQEVGSIKVAFLWEQFGIKQTA